MTYQQIGNDGEDLVCSWLKKKGHTVEKSEDPYDSFKDLLIDGKTAEVKTQTIYRYFPFHTGKEPAFTIPIVEDRSIHSNQLCKCLNVDILYFVSRSSYDYPFVSIYQAPELGKRYFINIENKTDNRIVAGFKIADMIELVRFSNKLVVDHFKDNWK